MARLIPVDPFDLVIFGGNGDLAMRKLLPSLFHRDQDGQILDGSRIIAAGRSGMSRETYLAQVADALRAGIDEGLEQSAWDQFAARLEYVDLDALDHSTWDDLRALLTGQGDGEASKKLSLLGRVAVRAGRATGITTSPGKLREASKD